MDPFRLLFLASSMVPLFLSVPYTASAILGGCLSRHSAFFLPRHAQFIALKATKPVRFLCHFPTMSYLCLIE